MYNRAAGGWAKHWDFMLIDILCLQIAYILAYSIWFGFNRLVFADDKVLNDGGLGVVRYIGTNSCLIIPAKVNGRDVTEICENAFKNKTELISVDIRGEISSIGDRAFAGCTNLSDFKIGNFWGSLGLDYTYKDFQEMVDIGEDAFYGCCLNFDWWEYIYDENGVRIQKILHNADGSSVFIPKHVIRLSDGSYDINDEAFEVDIDSIPVYTVYYYNEDGSYSSTKVYAVYDYGEKILITADYKYENGINVMTLFDLTYWEDRDADFAEFAYDNNEVLVTSKYLYDDGSYHIFNSNGILIQSGIDSYRPLSDDNLYAVYLPQGLEEVMTDEGDGSSADITALISRDMSIGTGYEISTLGRVVVLNGTTLTIDEGGCLEAEIEVEIGGTIVVKNGGVLHTTMGGDITNYGAITVQQGGELKSTMGGVVSNCSGGVITLDGDFYCGCVEYDNAKHIWLENNGQILGSGNIHPYIIWLDGQSENPDDINDYISELEEMLDDQDERLKVVNDFFQ